MPRRNKHGRVKKWIIDVLCESIMSTKEIQDVIINRTYNNNVRIKQTPSIQKLSMILKRHKEFVRVNEYEYPAQWRLKNETSE